MDPGSIPGISTIGALWNLHWAFQWALSNLGAGELQFPTGPHLHKVEASNHLVEFPCSAPLKMATNFCLVEMHRSESAETLSSLNEALQQIWVTGEPRLTI